MADMWVTEDENGKKILVERVDDYEFETYIDYYITDEGLIPFQYRDNAGGDPEPIYPKDNY